MVRSLGCQEVTGRDGRAIRRPKESRKTQSAGSVALHLDLALMLASFGKVESELHVDIGLTRARNGA
jgi:hypothetical protein